MGALCSSLASTKRAYDDLPPELLDLVIAGLPDPADRARARAVCRSWHSAVRRNGDQPGRLPSTMSIMRRLSSLPGDAKDADTVGSTDDWLAVRVGKEHRKYLLHNPFFKKTVPLAELEAVIGDDKSMIYKFLMRSGADDLIAVITKSRRHAFMVIRPGHGVWLPRPCTRPYIEIIDFAFLQGKLYAITAAEDLIPFDLALDGEGRPVVTMGRRLIKPPLDDEDVEEEVEQVAAAPHDDITVLNSSTHFWSHTELDDYLIITSRHLIESRGKLLMRRHHKQIRGVRDYHPGASYITLGVELFEADTAAGAWMPVTGGLGGGQALFISFNFSKSVAAPCGEVEEDVIYFMGTGEVYDLEASTCRPSQFCMSFGRPTWLFHPELVF